MQQKRQYLTTDAKVAEFSKKLQASVFLKSM